MRIPDSIKEKWCIDYANIDKSEIKYWQSMYIKGREDEYFLTKRLVLEKQLELLEFINEELNGIDKPSYQYCKEKIKRNLRKLNNGSRDIV